MLFGEYSVMLGSSALVVPFNAFFGQLRYNTINENKTAIDSNKALQEYFSYLTNDSRCTSLLQLNRLESAIKQQLYFDSNIPQGYGAGSSGALVAAIYDQFAIEKEHNNLKVLQFQLAALESYFHGNSSGLDPLTCYLNQPVLIGNDASILRVPFSISNSNFNVYLIDTKTVGKTAPLVEYFRNQLHYYSFFKKISQRLIPAVNGAVGSILNNETGPLFEALQQISQFQYDFLKPMIPATLQESWKRGLDTTDTFFKLCGSGGGGFILLFSKNHEKAIKLIQENELQAILL